jgi:hypothetical protein
MSTYLERANDIVAAGINGVPTSEQKQRIAEAAINYRPDLLALAVDPNNPTAEEKAHVFVAIFREEMIGWLKATAMKGEASLHVADVQAAGEAAAADLAEV